MRSCAAVIVAPLRDDRVVAFALVWVACDRTMNAIVRSRRPYAASRAKACF
jgi:hypothetical protein